MFKEIQIGHLELAFEDSRRRGAETSFKKLKPLLIDSLSTFQAFFKREKSLASEARKAKYLELSVHLCGRAKIRSLNKGYRQKDYATDVLSFPVHESLRQNAFVGFPQDVLHLGDIFICREVAKKQAKEFEISYEAEVVHLLIHGLLHLCGYDHELSLEEEKIMTNLEDKLMKKIAGKKNG